MNYQINRLRAQFKNTKPSLTDQSAAKDTDINVIVKQFGLGGQALGTTKTPLYEDFTQYPDDLRGFIETSRAVREHIGNLPPELKNLPMDQLLNLPPKELLEKLVKKPAPPPAPEPEK